MPQTSPITLLPPKPLQFTINPPASGSSETSFEQTLRSAQHRSAPKSQDDQDKARPAKAEKGDKSTARKAGKSAKSQRGRKNHSQKLQDDGEESNAAADTDDSSHTPTHDQSADGNPEDAKEEKPKGSNVEKSGDPQPLISAAALAAQPSQPGAKTAHASHEPQDGQQSQAVTLKAKAATAKASPILKGRAKSEGANDDAATDPKAAKADSKQSIDGNDITAKTVGIVDAKIKSAAHSKGSDTQNSVASTTTSTNAPDTASTSATDPASVDDVLQAVTDALGDTGSSTHSSQPDSAAPNTATPTGFEQQLQRAGVARTSEKTETPAPTAPEQQFVDANHPKIVTGVHGQLLPDGGTMQIRLDPAALGSLQVTVHMKDGVMTASFETSNAEATRMLSHSLNDLKTSLEAAGINVEKMHVQQSTKQDFRDGSSGDQQKQNNTEQQHEAKQEQQRREMLQRMWRKLAGGGDPVDLIA